MHSLIGQVALVWSDVLLGAQSHQSVLEEVDAQRLATGDEHVNSKIELFLLNEEGFADVVLGDAAHCCVDLRDLSREVYAAPLAAGVRLHYEGLLCLSLFVKLLPEGGHLLREYKAAKMGGRERWESVLGGCC